MFCPHSLPEDYSAKAVGVHGLPVGLAVLDARRVCLHNASGSIVVVLQSPSQSPSAGVVARGFPYILVVAVAVRARRWRVLASSSFRDQCTVVIVFVVVQGHGIPVQPVIHAQPTAAGTVHSARQQQRVEGILQ